MGPGASPGLSAGGLPVLTPEIRGASIVPSLPRKTKAARTAIPNTNPTTIPSTRSIRRLGVLAGGELPASDGDKATQDNVRGVRPGRDNIAAPDLPAELSWIGPEPDSMPALTAGGPGAGPLLRLRPAEQRAHPALPERVGRRYREAGLSVIGVQAPRFPFGADPATVAAGLERLGVEFPVAIDAERELWDAYGCEGWPSLFLWSLGGALSWVHFGEGEYLGTEDGDPGRAARA